VRIVSTYNATKKLTFINIFSDHLLSNLKLFNRKKKILLLLILILLTHFLFYKLCNFSEEGFLIKFISNHTPVCSNIIFRMDHIKLVIFPCLWYWWIQILSCALLGHLDFEMSSLLLQRLHKVSCCTILLLVS
jgi:hypothetical protein